MSKRKGGAGERDAAKTLTATFGLPAHRGRQYHGGPDSPDVVWVKGTHVEVKRTERLRLYDAMDQAEADAGEDVPVVLHRRSRKPWLLVLRLPDAPRFMRALLEAGWTWR